MSKKYIGVDLGAWYGDKTSIAILEEIEGFLTLKKIIREFSADNKIECIYHKEKPVNYEFQFEDNLQTKLEDSKKKIINTKNWSLFITPEEKNEKLVEYLLEQKGTDNTIIGIDAPFAIPYYLSNPLEKRGFTEKLYNPNNEITGELMNQFIYDNSARFTYMVTDGEKVLAPAGDKIGKMTARMVHIASHYKNELNIIKSPYLDIQNKNITTIEVYPRATLKILLINRLLEKLKKLQWSQLSESLTLRDFNYQWIEFCKKSNIPSYKNNNWEKLKEEMIGLIEKHINEWKDEINTDDDYDAIICALTCYLIDKNGYEKPEDKDFDKFTNSFIYIPKVEK